MKYFHSAFLTTVSCLLYFSATYAETYTGKVIKVVDGDTISILMRDNEQLRIRLAHIDAPERGQPYGRKSRDALAIIAGKNVVVQQLTVDRYSRIIGEVYYKDELINLRMVEKGMAWVYRKYSDDPSYLEAERLARDARAGLWGDADPIPPWDWRRRK